MIVGKPLMISGGGGHVITSASHQGCFWNRGVLVDRSLSSSGQQEQTQFDWLPRKKEGGGCEGGRCRGLGYGICVASSSCWGDAASEFSPVALLWEWGFPRTHILMQLQVPGWRPGRSTQPASPHLCSEQASDASLWEGHPPGKCSLPRTTHVCAGAQARS